MTYEAIRNKFQNSDKNVVVVTPDDEVQKVALGMATMFAPGSYSASRREWTNSRNAKVKIRGICSPAELDPDTEVIFFPVTRPYTERERNFIRSWRVTPTQ